MNGPIKYPSNHKPGMAVPRGGSSCQSCEYYKGNMICGQKDFILWNGSEHIPAERPDEYCSDWYEPNDKEEVKAPMRKHNFKETNIELHHDGSATIHHVHEEGPHKDVKHAAADIDAIHDSLQDHLNPDEEEKEEVEHTE